MRTIGMLQAAVLASIAAIGTHAPGMAQQPAAPVAGEEAEDAAAIAKREAATNRALLQALVRRRAAIEQSANDPESRRYALDFIDRRVARLKNRIGS